MDNDVQIAWKFFEMLKRNGVEIEHTSDNGQGFKIISFQGNETIEVCFFPDGKYWRIMGNDGPERFYSDEIHKRGWNQNE